MAAAAALGMAAFPLIGEEILQARSKEAEHSLAKASLAAGPSRSRAASTRLQCVV